MFTTTKLLGKHWSPWSRAPEKQCSENYRVHDIGSLYWCTWFGKDGRRRREGICLSPPSPPLLPYPFPVYPCNAGWYTNMVVTKGLQGVKKKIVWFCSLRNNSNIIFNTELQMLKGKVNLISVTLQITLIGDNVWSPNRSPGGTPI